MPSVSDIMEMAELLKVKAIGIEEDKCVVVRNRNATCTKCMDACIRSCISASRNELSIDSAACVNCGACVCVCPTGALSTLEPTVESMAASIASSSDTSSGLAVIACARKASKHEADAEHFSEVACLGQVNEALLVSCAASGLVDMVLVDGDCTTCKYGAVSPSIDETINNAVELLESARSEAIITRASEFPEEIEVGKDARRSFRGEDRRGLLFQTGGYVRKVATGVAKKTIDDKLGVENKPKTLRDRLSAGQSGRMPSFKPEGNFEIVEALVRILSKSGVDVYDPDDDSRFYLDDTVLNTRHFGKLDIDLEKCSGCGLCVLFCPTEAISHSQYETPEDPDRKYLEFDASLCTQCRLCEDVCIRKCLEIDSHVKLSSIFEMDPELVEINKPQERASIFDFNRNRNR